MIKHQEGGNNPKCSKNSVKLCGFDNNTLIQLVLAAEEADMSLEEEERVLVSC